MRRQRGWQVRPVGRDGKANYWHDGSLPGTATLLVRRWDGLSWAALTCSLRNQMGGSSGSIGMGP